MNTHPAVARHNAHTPMHHPVLGEDNLRHWEGLYVSFLTGTTKDGSIAQRTGEVLRVEFRIHGGVYFTDYVIREDVTGVKYVVNSGRVLINDGPRFTCSQCGVAPVMDDCGVDSVCDTCHVSNAQSSTYAVVARVTEEPPAYGCYVSWNGYDRSEETVCERPPLSRGVCVSCERAEHGNRWRKFVYAMGHGEAGFSEV